ncbi:MAG: STAS domain-containing protein [Leptospiraceae bacterium]|nr:STAS domain-containing protein [Leptospiraceae bacterium]
MTDSPKDRLECNGFVAFHDERSTATCLVLAMEGKIDNNNSYEINRKIHNLLQNPDFNCVLDLSKLEYINSTGIAILFSLFFRVKENERSFLIGSLHPFLERIFQLMDFPPGLEITKDTDLAIERLQA